MGKPAANRSVLAGFAATKMIPLLECCKPGDALYKRNYDLIDPDFNALMNFFCNEWRGKSGELSGCAVPTLPGNAEAVAVFSSVGKNATPSEIKTAMDLFGVEDVQDCWWRVQAMIAEFR